MLPTPTENIFRDDFDCSPRIVMMVSAAARAGELVWKSSDETDTFATRFRAGNVGLVN